MSCKGCTKRYVGCHGKCEEYAKEVEERKRIREEIQAGRVQDYLLTWRRLEIARMYKEKKRK